MGGDNWDLWPRKGGTKRPKLGLFNVQINFLGVIIRETMYLDYFLNF